MIWLGFDHRGHGEHRGLRGAHSLFDVRLREIMWDFPSVFFNSPRGENWHLTVLMSHCSIAVWLRVIIIKCCRRFERLLLLTLRGKAFLMLRAFPLSTDISYSFTALLLPRVDLIAHMYFTKVVIAISPTTDRIHTSVSLIPVQVLTPSVVAHILNRCNSSQLLQPRCRPGFTTNCLKREL